MQTEENRLVCGGCGWTCPEATTNRAGKNAQDCRRRMIATDGVFSMDGNVAPLKEICDLADKYSALVFVDDCHAIGFDGETGRVSEEFCGASGRVYINSTLGYCSGPHPIIDLLRQRSRPYLFSNALAPAVVGSSMKVVELLTETSDFAQSLLSKTHRFRSKMANAGFKLGGNPEQAFDSSSHARRCTVRSERKMSNYHRSKLKNSQSLKDAQSEAQMLRQCLSQIAQIRNMRAEKRTAVRKGANTLPLWVGKLGEESPPPLCGAVPPEDGFICTSGQAVAALVKGQEDEQNWILAEVLSYQVIAYCM